MNLHSDNNNASTIGMNGICARVVAYGAVLAGAALGLGLEQPLGDRADLYTDYGLTERLQDLALMAAFACFALVAWLRPAERPLAILLAGLCLAALVREWDFFLDGIADSLWQVLVTIVLALTAAWLWRLRAGFRAALQRFTGQPAFGLMLAGFLVVMVFSRLYGTDSLWQTLLHEHYSRSVKNLAQEGVELLGYALMLCAALDYLWSALSSARASRRRP